MNKLLREELHKGLEALDLNLSSSCEDKLMEFMQLLIKWNKAYNLTAIDQPEDILTHHFFDSLSILPYINGEKVLDVGSGGGFPGIPCAIADESKKFFLIDSNGKKTRFLLQAVLELKLPNVIVIQERIERYHPEGCFDTIMARAFAQIEMFVQFTKKLLCPDGQLLMMKGTYPESELQNLTGHVKVYSLSIPGLPKQRHLVRIKGLE